MRRSLLIIAGLLAVGAGASQAGMFPAELTYRIYVYGEFAGEEVIKISETEDVLLFNSHSQLTFEEFSLDLHTRTEVSRDDFSPRYFSYEGIRAGQKVSGTISFDGDSISGDFQVEDAAFPSGKKLAGRKLIFENYIIEHQLLLLNVAAESDELINRVQLFFPVDFTSASCASLIESEVEIDTVPRRVCTKYRFTIASGSTFYGYLDAKRKLAVYMDFPDTNTEVFLKGAFADEPLTKYTRPESSP